MSNPVVEAAQRAWASNEALEGIKYSPGEGGIWTPDAMESAAREALEPLRKLHRKSPIYNLAEDCDICSDDDENIQAQHTVIDSTYGEYLCTATVCAYTCAYCSELRGPDQDLPDWPCETAMYLYSAEELGFTS